jgi:hypothetical protein
MPKSGEPDFGRGDGPDSDDASAASFEGRCAATSG